MIKRKVTINWIMVLMAMTYCSVKDQQVVYRDRAALRSVESRADSLYRDSLMVFFEQGFDGTLIEIKRNLNVVYRENITTSQAVQLATVKNMGSNKKFKEFSISINGGNFIPIKIIDPFKYVAVSYLKDTVYIDYMVHYPMYE